MSIGRILVYAAPRIWRRSPPVASTMGSTVASASRTGSKTRSTPGMIQARGQRELALEHLPRGLGIRELRIEDLQRDVGVAQLITRAPYLAVPAGTEFFDKHEAAAQLGAGLVLVCHGSSVVRLTNSGDYNPGWLTLLDAGGRRGGPGGAGGGAAAAPVSSS